MRWHLRGGRHGIRLLTPDNIPSHDQCYSSGNLCNNLPLLLTSGWHHVPTEGKECRSHKQSNLTQTPAKHLQKRRFWKSKSTQKGIPIKVIRAFGIQTLVLRRQASDEPFGQLAGSWGISVPLTTGMTNLKLQHLTKLSYLGPAMLSR